MHICVTVIIKEIKAVNLRMGLLRRVGERVPGGAASGEGKGENNVTIFLGGRIFFIYLHFSEIQI